MATHGQVLDALARVRDPELDESITALGFVQSVEVDGSAVSIELRLPTFYCAPNFSYMMVADARDAIETVPGVDRVYVRLVDHHDAEQISEGVAQGHDFATTYPDQAEGDDDLIGLREIFRGKAYYARLHRLCAQLLAQGRTQGDLAMLYLRDVPESDETSAYLERRAELGLDLSPEAPLLVALDGRVVPLEETSLFLRRARLFDTSIESNGEYCRSLLQFRYGLTEGAAE